MIILGLDIGYSNLKFVFGDGENEKKEVILPSGAGPLTSLPITLTGERIDRGVEVKVGDELWASGVAHQHLSGVIRELHANYPATNTYKALFKAALITTGATTIDILVTGLPVDQFKDKDTVAALKNSLQGVHQVNESKEVEVRRVIVIPQPAGGYVNLIRQSDDETLNAITSGITVSIDPGFFSVDWVVIDNGDIRSELSGTNLQAMSVVLKEISDSILENTRARITVDRLEEAIRRGENEFFAGNKTIDITPYVKKASLKISEQAMKPMLESLRHEHNAISSIILSGGGANFYKEVAEKLFVDTPIFTGDKPVLANANGFYNVGCNAAKYQEN